MSRNFTTAEVAAIFKRQGVANPLEAACGAVPSGKPNKYNARKKEIDGITFDSTAEARRYQQLKIESVAGAIWNLQLQPEYILQDAFRDESGKYHRAIKYRADFTYLRRFNGGTCKQIVEDVKGMVLPTFAIKQKLFAAKFPFMRLDVIR